MQQQAPPQPITTRATSVQGTLLLASAALAWSFGGLWIKEVHLNSMAVAGARSAVAALIIWIYARTTGSITLGDYRKHLPGAIAYAGTVIFFVAATKNTTAANAILLQYTAPIWVALFSRRILGEVVTLIDWITVALVMVGMSVFFIDDIMKTSGGMFGNVLAVISGVFFAACAISLRKQRASSPILTVLFGNFIAAVIGLPFLIGESMPTGHDFLFIALLGVVQLALGYILFVGGVRRVTALQSILVPMIEPILNPVWVAIFSSERPTDLALVGGVIVVGAVAFQGIVKVLRVSTTPR